jgi:hypothetical protein
VAASRAVIRTRRAIVRDGRVPYVWGEFEVDCATNEVTGPRQALVDDLTRAWLRTAPGRLAAMTYDPAGGVFTARGTGAAKKDVLVAYWPARLHGEPEVNVTGLERVKIRPAWGGSYVIARANGGDWTLTVETAAP